MPYGVIVPREVSNLLLPVPVCGSHIGFSTLGMEPCWMALGQAAGAAAAIAINDKTPVQTVDVEKLQNRLLEEGATLIYFNDVDPTDKDFAEIQRDGLRGLIPEWNARGK